MPSHDVSPRVGFLRGAFRSARWLLATAWGSALLFALLWLESNRAFGPTPLRDDLHQTGWIQRGLSHPCVVIVAGDSGPRLAVLMDEQLDPNVLPVMGQIELRTVWTRGTHYGEPSVLAARRVELLLDAPTLDKTSRDRLTADFLALQRAWGNADLADALLTGPNPGVVQIRYEIRWGVLAVNTRAITILVAFVLSLAANFMRFCNAVLSIERRDVRTVRLSRGLCPACEYPIQDLPSPVCPECGEALPS